ncbi:Transcriptional activator, Rgg/GadR/MutR family, C-terminal domain-containing protein [Lacicoccus alkaliphilus]|uniref:Transcriptional activator, Rgg/GadR/MutR family, C-terminal domain-containing protein n=2 Tax=Lacicoccus TaxID=3076172 RepID=A0A1M7K562_9BACL|nr:transcriptional activator, Rgg/GadR/MutR family, C-terminal domain-containing protein [Salinicoccus alkaliphilus DSM 16010]
MSNQSIGMLIREFRQSRNLTMKEVCDNDLSIAQLSKFERGVSEITINKLLMILDKLNITVEEFFHAEKEFELSEFEQLILDMKEHYINRDVDKILALRDGQSRKYEERNIKFFELNAIMLSALIKDLDEDQYDWEDREPKLIDHLMEVDIWCNYEIVLFANSISLFTVEALVMLTNEMINNTQYYHVIGKHRTITIQTLTNVILILLEKGETFHSKMFHDTLEELLEIDQYMLYEKNVSKYLNGFHHFSTGEEARGIQLMEESIQTFDILDRKQLADNFRAHLNNLQMQK